MADQKVEGYAQIFRNIRRYFRFDEEGDDDSLDKQSIVDAIWEAETWLSSFVVASGVHWATKSVTIDDTDPASVGTEVEHQSYRYFLNSDLGITDFAKMAILSRVDQNGTSPEHFLTYLENQRSGVQRIDPGALLGPTAEYWTERGETNPTTGRPE